MQVQVSDVERTTAIEIWHDRVQPALPLGEQAQHWEDGESHPWWWHLVHPRDVHLFSSVRGRNTR